MFHQIKVALAFSVVCLLTFPSPGLSALEGGSWVERVVVTKTEGIRISRTDDQDRQVDLGTLNDINYTVLKEQGPWIMVRENGVEGWALKEKFVLLEDAPGYFTQRIRADAEDSRAWACRGEAWRKKGELDNAIKDLTEAIRLSPELAPWYTNRANVYSEKKEYDRTIADSTEAIRLDPKYAKAYVTRGLAYTYKKDYERAIGDYTKAIRLKPKYVLAYENRAFAYAENKEYDRAIADNKEAIRLDPKSNVAFYNMACCFALQGQSDLAIENLDRSLELGWREFEHMEKDSDLDSVRGDPRYKKLLEKYAK